MAFRRRASCSQADVFRNATEGVPYSLWGFRLLLRWREQKLYMPIGLHGKRHVDGLRIGFGRQEAERLAAVMDGVHGHRPLLIVV